MTLASDIPDVSDDHPIQHLGFYVASRWMDLPQSITNQFDAPPSNEYVLKKQLVRSSILAQPQSGVYVLYLTNSQGQRRFVAKYFPSFQPERLCQQDHLNADQFMSIGLAILLMFLASIAMLLSILIKPIEQLKQWATALSSETSTQSRIKFRFQELDNLAQIIESNINTAKESIKNEKEFLDFTNHEMRTPLTVIRNNIELLKFWDRLSSEKRKDVINRLERGAWNLTNLTETMLWLNCSKLENLNREVINLSLLLKEVIEDNRYLLHGKSVSLELNLDDFECLTYPVALKIVLSNLVRNAFQHTQEGKVIVSQNRNSVTIENSNINQENCINSTGFGLGLKLINKIIDFTQWELVDIENETSRKSILSISNSLYIPSIHEI
ncbi:HAMP domain-containing histidine kinase [Shewanella sp. D64]|uniref:sensor histidine kinase n=1 Tax=unclassified Shewanella TaxID=196818 RepID=UPI0022BA62C1|nr:MULTISPECIES: HAMP domain-containing sensor histidine kinase [unclassified Shewanella]MEC4727147.1 HAMP domain-containing histidine kinase [Shewanella sp. D64]MEC4739236.1 HAMP domain-containing histidine kinase [Shewanella sp. E94]WBJ95576.1 HAMP domain-containing histidine kinase [Shewanella sp. MTB7]